MVKTVMKQALAAVVVFALVLPNVPALGQTDDDDDDMSGGALAVLLLGVGGAVAGVLYATLHDNDVKGALDKRKIRYSDAQLRSIKDQATARLKAMRGKPGQFTVCTAATPRRICLRVVVQDETKQGKPAPGILKDAPRIKTQPPPTRSR